MPGDADNGDGCISCDERRWKEKKERAERKVRHEKRVADAISRGSDIRCCASEVQKHRGEIDEHPETLKTCRRSAIGTRDRAIIGNRSALMDRYRGSFPLRSLLFLFYPSLQMTWKNAEEDEEEEEEKEKR